jgi:hypothetical protein
VIAETARAVMAAQAVAANLKLTGWIPDNKGVGEAAIALLSGDMATTLRKFQEWSGLETTGELDAATRRAATAPRFCGVPDVLHLEAVGGGLGRWPNGEVRWWVSNPDDFGNLTRRDALTTFDAAFGKFPMVCGIKVRNVASRSDANCVITATPIDGGNGVLAQSELANGVEDVKGQEYDAENWSTEYSDSCPPSAISLRTVAEHEFMHFCGVPHAPVNSGALIAPRYTARTPTLTDYDIDQLVRRYGKPNTSVPVPPGIEKIVMEAAPVIAALRAAGYRVTKE